ncbi:fructosamine kinase [Halalkalibacillus sediminis]|uniref:Fructosamine kinase n=1 Tax=Halalkalibacillus sediminis TaxID=2018042 RepID=A0A2I0QYI1_9BACI|nr:fructosamine kinase family protein [Halalkalibacillus sediminis]PKR79170.1 fructosamine kinase [Halalkalibacillus sediminis]
MLDEIIDEALKQAGESSTARNIQSVSGGSINESYYVEMDQNQYFVKYHATAPAHFFEAEAKGLENIRSTDSIDTPEVLAYQDKPGQSFLVMEWMSGESTQETQSLLGERIAKMHLSHAEYHGLDQQTFIGDLPQPNQLCREWVDYYRTFRLERQLELGRERHRIADKREEKLIHLIDNLEKYIPHDIAPSYLHGDLWSGNWLPGPKGTPYVIDPSFLYGDRHFDLAFTEMFGGFTQDFYNAYNEIYPISSDYEVLKPIYQLYYSLVHLNMFGESYGGLVDRILKRYA